MKTLKDRKTQSIIKVRMDRLTLGNLGDAKSIGQGVMELRIDYGPGFRIYFGESKNNLILILCGGDKSAQIKDIANAQSYWADYKSKNQNEN